MPLLHAVPLHRSPYLFSRFWQCRCLDGDLLSMVLELPPAPAALVLLGRWLETFSARSAAAFLRITVAGPPGGLGDAWRAVVVPVAALFTGELGRGADCSRHVSCCVRGAGD